MVFDLLIDFRAHQDVENAVDYYISKSQKVANDFYNKLEDAYGLLKKNPFFQVRYADYRCLPVKGYPYMFHFTVDENEKVVRIHALINTSKNPDSSWLKI